MGSWVATENPRAPSLPGVVILMLKIRRSPDRLIFIMGLPILVRRHLYIKTPLRPVKNERKYLIQRKIVLLHHKLSYWDYVYLFTPSNTGIKYI